MQYNKCKCTYIGETKRQLNERFGEHRRSILIHQQLTDPTPISLHFNQAGQRRHSNPTWTHTQQPWRSEKGLRSSFTVRLHERWPPKQNLETNFEISQSQVACVAAGPRTRLNHLYSLYTEGLERLRRRQVTSRHESKKYENYYRHKIPLKPWPFCT